jgi:putative methanogenesis marker protein 8
MSLGFKERHMKDIHVVRYFSSLITIYGGKVIKITKPSITHCPLAGFLYSGLKRSDVLPPVRLKLEIRRVIEGKIAQFGFCSKRRVLWDDGTSVPYGASEILAHGLKNDIIDSAVIVCDGAGTVLAPIPQVVQGVGARMHSIIRTSAIPDVIAGLKKYGCRAVRDDGAVDQEKGVVEAAKEGYKRVAVTINAYKGENLKDVRALEKKHKISVAILVVCTTGIKQGRINEIEKYADLVWACHSKGIKDRLNKKAIKILSGVSPVYVLTEKGAELVSGYLPNIFGVRKEAGRRAAP